MITAKQMVEKKVWAQRAYRVAIRRQSFSLLNVLRLIKGKCSISGSSGW